MDWLTLISIDSIPYYFKTLATPPLLLKLTRFLLSNNLPTPGFLNGPIGYILKFLSCMQTKSTLWDLSKGLDCVSYLIVIDASHIPG